MPDFVSSQEWTPHLPDLNLLDYSIWDILQELVYKGRRELFANLKDLETVIGTNGMMLMIRQREKLFCSEKAFSSSGKAERRTYSAHFLLIS